MRQPKGLIEVLEDHSAREDERHDAAMDLRKYPTEQTEATLISIASDVNEDILIAEAAGESLVHIWLKKQRFDTQAFALLTDAAKSEMVAAIKSHRPEWLEQYHITL